jgi:hypothetical protein
LTTPGYTELEGDEHIHERGNGARISPNSRSLPFIEPASGAEGGPGIIRQKKKWLIVAWIWNAPDEWGAGVSYSVGTTTRIGS